MKTYLECFPCFLRQALHLAKICGLDEEAQKKVIDQTGALFAQIDVSATSPQIAFFIHNQLKSFLQKEDPYAQIKEKNVAEAIKHLPLLQTKLQEAKDPLFTACRLAIAGNVIDLGAHQIFDLGQDLQSVLSADFTIDDFDEFAQDVQTAKKIVYLGDNTAEGVFDKLLIEQINKPIIYATRHRPVINDITIHWAKKIGLDSVATVVSSGAQTPGTVPELCSADFQRCLAEADLIISKGQGNYEALSDTNLPIYFFLKAKCQVIADHIGVPLSSYLLIKNQKGKQ